MKRWVWLMAVVGCGGSPGAGAHPVQADGKRHWEIEIDPAFSASDQQAIVDAAESWSATVPVKFDVAIVYTGAQTYVESASLDAVNTLCGTTGKTGCTAGDGSKILIAKGFAAWEGCIAHELGHLQGLHHSTNPNDLMWPITGGRSGPQSGDVEAWHRLWD